MIARSRISKQQYLVQCAHSYGHTSFRKLLALQGTDATLPLELDEANSSEFVQGVSAAPPCSTWASGSNPGEATNPAVEVVSEPASLPADLPPKFPKQEKKLSQVA